jgi:hypothetical protein
MPLPKCLLYFFCNLDGINLGYFLFGLICWGIILLHHEDFAVILGVEL